jgi:Zn-dependent protease with chaperone function
LHSSFQRDEADADDFGADFEDDPELAAIKARRIAELQAAYEQARANKNLGHGEYMDITQDEFLSTGMPKYFV